MKTDLPKAQGGGLPERDLLLRQAQRHVATPTGIKNSIACLQQIKPIAEEQRRHRAASSC